MSIPQHLGIIMDGNRRWAKKHGLASIKGHQAGYKKAKEIIDWCKDSEIKILTLFSFSTENWQRPKIEVNFLMRLLELVLTKDIKELHKNNIRLQIIGRKEGLPERLREIIKKAENLTKDNNGFFLNLAINYGGRQEIVDAFNKIIKNAPKKITEELISENIYTSGLPDPDFIIRTSGEHRLSGFLLWQSAYSELYFTEKLWPDFSRKDFEGALLDFANRQRRFGK